MRREWVRSMEFVASESFPEDYEYVHEKPCVCAVCNKPIKPKQVIKWVGNSLVHIACIDSQVDSTNLNPCPLIESGREVAWEFNTRYGTIVRHGKVIAFIPAGTSLMDVAKELNIDISPSKLSGSNYCDVDRYLVASLDPESRYDYYTPNARLLEKTVKA